MWLSFCKFLHSYYLFSRGIKFPLHHHCFSLCVWAKSFTFLGFYSYVLDFHIFITKPFDQEPLTLLWISIRWTRELQAQVKYWLVHWKTINVMFYTENPHLGKGNHFCFYNIYELYHLCLTRVLILFHGKIQSVFGSGSVVTVARYETPAHTGIDKVCRDSLCQHLSPSFLVWFQTIHHMTGKVKKKVAGSHPGLTGWTGSLRVPPGWPGFSGPIPKRVLASTRTGPMPGSAGSTRRAGPGFKTMVFKVGLHGSTSWKRLSAK